MAHRELKEASDKELEIWPHRIAGHAHFKEHNANLPFLMGWLKYVTGTLNCDVQSNTVIIL